MLKYRHLLSKEYSHIVPLPCALHVANLLTEDICRLEGLMDIIVKGNYKIMNIFMKSQMVSLISRMGKEEQEQHIQFPVSL